jgi:hypothetical protein
MSLISSAPPPKLENDVHKALVGWHSSPPDAGRLRSANPARPADAADPAAPRPITQEILLSALAILQSTHEPDAVLLKKRFVERKPSFVVANELNIAESTLYKLQKQAIHRLATIVHAMQQESASSLQAEFDARVPPRMAGELIGVDTQVEHLRTTLLAAQPPWLVVLTGLGGIGKTALAHGIYRRLVVDDKAFAGYAWVSAQQQFLDPKGTVTAVDQPALTVADLTEHLAAQVLHPGATPARHTREETIDALQRLMRRTPHLVVIDNLETLSDLAALVPLLRRLAGPTKFLLTSREALLAEPDMYHLPVPELARAHALALVRHEAGLRSLADVAAADDRALSPIYDTVGGNPLALKLVVGQLCYLSLDRVLQNLREAQGRKTDEFYRYIYWDSWRQLTVDAQMVLLLMPLFATSGAELANIEAVSDVKGGQLMEALEQLTDLSLVTISGDFRARRYGIHRLTETFLMQEIIKWTAAA